MFGICRNILYVYNLKIFLYLNLYFLNFLLCLIFFFSFLSYDDFLLERLCNIVSNNSLLYLKDGLETLMLLHIICNFLLNEILRFLAKAGTINHLTARNWNLVVLISWVWSIRPARIWGTIFKPGDNILKLYCIKYRLSFVSVFKLQAY